MPSEPSSIAYWDSGILMAILALIPVLWVVLKGRTQSVQLALDSLTEKFEILRSIDHVRLADFVQSTVDLRDQGRKIAAVEARQQDVIGRLDRIEGQLAAHIRAERAKYA